MFGFRLRRFSDKILAGVIVTVSLVMVTEIFLRIYFGTKDRMDLMEALGLDLAAWTYAGIKYPMSVGDSQAVERVLADVHAKVEDVEVFVCDFDQVIIWSTHRDKIHARITEVIASDEAMATLREVLQTGVSPPRSFVAELHDRKHLMTVQPILNHEECYHCHGSSRKVIGAMVIRTDAQRTYASVAAARDRTILISILGISAIIVLIYVMVNRLVRRPVEGLALAAKKFAEGDMTVSVDVVTDDEIGVLGSAFNHMVQRMSLFNKTLEEEVAKKTALLNERTKLIGLLERANSQLRELDRLKSSFLANMSHELRTPMNSIIGYSDLLLDGVDGPVNEEQAKSLEKISTNARHLLKLLNDILDLSKIESGKTEIEPHEIDVKELIHSVVPFFEPIIAKKGLKFDVLMDDALETVYADEDKIKHVLMNLLSNAIKFTHSGGITVRTMVSKRGIQPGQRPIFAEIVVEDTGIGIREENLDKIFNKFVQADLSTVRQYEGTGLGLSIARGLVALHKGMIWVTSEYGKGSQFHFTVPLNKDILEMPGKPVVELQIADALADYFGLPVETFLKRPEYAGKPVKCWEYVHCGEPSCPAYGSEETRCWLVLGTHCAGLRIAAYPEKVDFCKSCEVIQRLVLGSDLQEAEIPGRLRGGTRKTVLAIDDNPEALDIIRKSLGDDYEVIGLHSGERAVEKARSIRPVAITLDIMMPHKDGWQVLKELKNSPDTEDIPVMVLSIVDDKKTGFSLGAAEYLVKPVEKAVLLKKIRNLAASAKIRKVLVVDNEAETVVSVVNALEDEGYHVEVAYNSQEGIKRIQEFRPEIIILNISMPKVSGFDIIEFIKTESKIRHIPLILIARKNLTNKDLEDLNGRIKGILQKGAFKKEDLIRDIREGIGKIALS